MAIAVEERWDDEHRGPSARTEPGSKGNRGDGAGKAPPPRSARQPRHFNARATTVDMTRFEGGDARVHIDDRGWFQLNRGEADLLEIALEDPGVDEGSLVDWKSREAVILRLGMKARKSITPGALKTKVYRLRKALAAAGHDPWLFQVRRGHGL